MVMSKGTKNLRGFTIVELLIVIVVIAILAAVTLVTYGGIQQRASNAAIIDAASKTLRFVSAYIAANGTYPAKSDSCITVNSGCMANATAILANSTFETNMATIGTLPRAIPMTDGAKYGVVYSYYATRTLSDVSQPALIYYWLYGTAQQCGISGVVTGWIASTPAANGYTLANDNASGRTLCYITIPGPAA